MVELTHAEVLAATGAKAIGMGARFAGVPPDSGAGPPGQLFVALVGEKFDGHAFVAEVAAKGAAGAVVQAGKSMPATLPGFALYEVPDTLRALGALARLHRQRFAIPVGAVGGSNGKTTTKEMVASILATRGP